MPEHEMMINSLILMGYEREVAAFCLKSVNYNSVERAVEYLH